MNYISISLIAAASLALVVYFFKSYKKLSEHEMPFLKAFNPFYNVEAYQAYLLKTSLKPILTEIDTKRMANFINTWKNKFEFNTLTLEDVKYLNEQVVDGNTSRLDGILALHPNAAEMYGTLNESLKPVEEEIEQEELVEAN